jgi:octaprenyl-diphosphate synthase
MLEAASPPTLPSIRAPVRDRLAEVRRAIAELVVEDYPSIDEVNDYLLEMEGKLLRPTLVLLCDQIEGRRSRSAVRLAAVVEMIHVATLVHDDAVDHSVQRRGMPTVNARWTHQVAVIMGDYLYSRAMTEIARLGELEAIELLARAANRMTVGEMRQLVSHDALDFSEDDYYRLCECKTASLMAASCELGALAGAPEHRERLREFGFDLGMAFQITDDLLDYTGSERDTGKPTGLDLREHKVTLPLIAALPAMDGAARERVDALFADPDPDAGAVDAVMGDVARHGGLEYARDRVAEFLESARRALEGVPSGDARDALALAVDFVARRRR